jgi:hypothetical protein
MHINPKGYIADINGILLWLAIIERTFIIPKAANIA